MNNRNQSLTLSESYDQVANEYTKRIAGELAGKPADRAFLAELIQQVGSLGAICDIGCGPGHIAGYLRELGCKEVLGVDISPRMIQEARSLYPELSFTVGNMLNLDIPNDSLGGIVAFYSIIHIAPDQLGECFKQFLRVLRPGGTLLASFHIGDDTVHLEEWWGKSVSLDFHFYQPSTVAKILENTGFTIDRIIEREPYSPDIEHQSQRAYIFARKEK